MSEAKLDVQWIPKSACPVRATITDVELITETFKGRPYQTARLMLTANGNLYQYDAKFGDKNYLINVFGSNTDEWMKQEITIAVDPVDGYKKIVS